MEPKRGYYSLVQFLPDASRMETVNVGVVLFCPSARFLSARMSRSNKRAQGLVGRGRLERSALNAAKRAIERRLEVDRDSFEDIEDLQRYIDTRGNWLRLTPARPIKVFDPPKDLDKLYTELVGGVPKRQKAAGDKLLFPELDRLFRKLKSEGRAEIDKRVTILMLERQLDVPYAFFNGSLNLVKPHRFSRRFKSSMDTAMRLAIEGDLIHRHGTSECGKARLIIVSSFENEDDEKLANRVHGLFREYKVTTVEREHVDDFVAKVKQQAH